MVKKRLVAALLVYQGIVVQSRGFGRYLPVGRPEIQAEFLNEWGIDEILLTFIDSPAQIDLAMVERVAGKCLVPLTVGGGIRRLEQADQLIHSGADRVFLNSGFLDQPTLVTEIARKYGDQAVVVGLDFQTDGQVYHPGKRQTLQKPLTELAQLAQHSGAGEILLQSTERDGSYQGYDLPAIATVTRQVSLPVIALGGAGCAQHIADLFQQTEACAAAVGNLLHFSEHSVAALKQQVIRANVDVRLETAFDYATSDFDAAGRLAKRSDESLEKLLFVRVEKEVI